MTQAQQEQQHNRDTGGRYTTKPHSEAQGVQLPPLELVSDEAATHAVHDATAMTEPELEAIGPEVVETIKHTRNFTPQHIRAVASQIGHQRLGYDPIGASAIRNALSQMEPEAAHYARNFLNQRHPQAFSDQQSTVQQPAAQPAPELEHPLGSPDNPISATSDAVQTGEVFDTVVSKGRTYHRAREGMAPMEPQAVRLQADQELTDDDVMKVAQITGYSLRSVGHGEGASDPVRDSPYSFILYNDTTKGDQYKRLDRFQSLLHTYVHQGTPIRSSNKKGPGTEGTRKIEGFGRQAPQLEIYYDDAEVFDG
ncbi:hypothetical protein A6F49_04645 [Enteractinococcus helveticum]|uniref:Uncharacterized protein n=2 Tax=Enteractinococcus helveticum TaxID=1837282 RepID=A0A1B7M2P3_9MICC|nr:hypothetical protein A6F49_04645 [Enteractinococcus helveticum]